ncbi:MAG: hypothetical protein C4B59_12200 [Candidatus Methanogaster sp.]|uniref:Uncharacterized protein n=1 Tax=Candidatus Methanogaster sp. TaxID=3386292 RepID=A0AC61L120_9EURY|nr:MAG: hypothetical protein C4B59_12200 [ANME-2 cluster archaeon]
MRQTVYSIVNTVRMMRTQYTGTILIVEGGTDARVYGRLVNEVECRLIPATGKDKAISALELLENSGFGGVLAIVDADFWRLDGIDSNSSNLLLTDSHDLETMILYSDVLDNVLSEFGSAREIAKLGGPIRDILLESGLPIGYLRWLSSPTKDNLSLKFKELSFDKFVDEQTLRVSIDNLIRELKINSENSTLDENATKLKIMTLGGAGHDPWQVCSGHDLVQILSIGLRNIFGNPRGKSVTMEVVDGILRVAYDHSHFRLTRLHNSIKDWEKANPSFNVLHRIRE